jgi:DNA polymerase-3 subunit delta'
MPFSDLIGHERPKAMLRAAIQQDCVAQAYLFHGERGIGKSTMALRFAQALNCETATSAEMAEACGLCRSCVQIEARTHPDCLFIESDPELATPQIKIEQIREIEQQIVYKPLVARRKVCLIIEADRMTLGAANALLKTLEEPPAHNIFILVTARPFALPATIRSRCQGVRFAAPSRADVEAALISTRRMSATDARFLAIVTESRIGEAFGTDLKAMRERQQEWLTITSPKMLRSVAALLAVAETLAKGDRVIEALEWMARWLRDVVLVQVGANPDLLLSHDRDELKDAASRFRLDALLTLLGRIEAMQRAATRNLNPQLTLETLLLDLRDALTPG